MAVALLADNPITDTRRITEADPAMARLKARTVRRLSASIQQLLRDLASGVQASQAQSHFIDRHLGILRDAYAAAHQEGQRDFYEGVSNTPKRWATHPVVTQTLQRRLSFYAPSVAKMAHEATRAYEAPKAVQMDEQAAQDWRQSVGARISLQADLTWAGGQDGYTQAGWSDTANPFEYLWWDLNPPSDHCQDCPSLAAASPYTAPWTTGPNANILETTPGAGATECGAGCRCSLRYGAGPEVGQMKSDIRDWLPQGTPDEALMPPPVPGAPRQPTETRAPLPPPPVGSRYGGPPAIPGGEFSAGQKRALDLYRMAELEWNDVRGQLPELPNFFMLAKPDYIDDFRRLNWSELTPQQRQALQMALRAMAIWDAWAPSEWFDELE